MSKSSRTGQGRIAHHVTNAPTTVAGCLQSHFGLDAAQSEELIALGAIYSNRQRVLRDRTLAKGEYLRIHLQPKRFPVTEVDWARVVVAETPEFVVALKPAGIPAHATLDNQVENLLAQLRRHTGKILLVTQRLDTPVAGLMVLAKTPDFQKRFNRYLSDRQVQKRYRALVEKAPPVGLQVHFMKPSDYGAKTVSLEEKPSWLRCELTVHSVAERSPFFDVTVELHTGRTHQIRSQLSALGSPIVGDRLYGSRATTGLKTGAREAIALFSARVGFPNPRGKAWSFEAEPPWPELVPPDLSTGSGPVA